MPVNNISIHSNIHDYEVSFEQSPDFLESLANLPQACFVIDKNVWEIYHKTILKNLPEEETIILPVKEDRKNLETVLELYDQLVTHPAKRNLTLISIGGGIIQDITGFTASTMYRGIKWIYVPTTLLAQADSCIGSKTSLNYRGYKNILGTFFPPERVYIYPPFLQSLLDSDYFSGLGEVLKLYLMGGNERFQKMIRLAPSARERELNTLYTIIRESLEIKLGYMAGDEFDRGQRNLLNFGHDFGHALESTSRFSVPHGQAVIFGMLAANMIAIRRSLLDEKLAREIAETLLIPYLVARPSAPDLDPEKIILAMRRDKKRTGDLLALIMMDNDFNFTKATDITPDEVRSGLQEIRTAWNF